MPHTDTNISRDALRSYGMQPARTQSGERGNLQKLLPEAASESAPAFLKRKAGDAGR